MKIYVIASDSKIDETIEMHEYIFQKYWSTADITVLGYTEPNYKSDFIKFESLGEDLGSNFLNKQLYNYFSKLNESQFIFCADDVPVTRTVDIELINYTEELLKNNKMVGRVGLTSDNVRRPHIEVSNVSDKVNLIESVDKNGHTFRISVTWSAWNSEYFLLYLNDYKTLWDWELFGSEKSNKDNFKILSFVPPPMRFSHLIKQDKFNVEWYKEAYHGSVEMLYEDQQKVREIYKNIEIGETVA